MGGFFAENQFLVGLSLDGPKEIHDANRRDAAGKGTFPAVMEAGRLLKKHGVPFNILCVVDNTVARNANQVLNFFCKTDFFTCNLFPVWTNWILTGKRSRGFPRRRISDFC